MDANRVSPSQPPRHSGPTAPEGEVEVFAAAAVTGGVESVVPAIVTAGGNAAVSADVSANRTSKLVRLVRASPAQSKADHLRPKLVPWC